MSFTRREFLKCCGRGVSAATMMTALRYAGLENAYAQGSDYKALVCIFLEGGNDGWNTIVPLGAPHSVYSSNRQGLALAQGSLLPLTFTGAALEKMCASTCAASGTMRSSSPNRSGTATKIRLPFPTLFAVTSGSPVVVVTNAVAPFNSTLS